MRRKTHEKTQAVRLRKKGLSYLEIREYLPVAKSTLSYWLRDIPLTREQKKRLKKKGGQFQHLASAAHRRRRIEKTRSIINNARSEIATIDKNTLLIIGTILYWAEGAKQKDHNPSTGLFFSNSDPKMLKLYLNWLKECLEIPAENLIFEIYIHETYKKTQKGLVNFWSGATGFPVSMFDKIRYKRNKIYSYRKNRGKNYWGVLRVKVRKSTDLNRRITGWTEGICLQCGVV